MWVSLTWPQQQQQRRWMYTGRMVDKPAISMDDVDTTVLSMQSTKSNCQLSADQGPPTDRPTDCLAAVAVNPVDCMQRPTEEGTTAAVTE